MICEEKIPKKLQILLTVGILVLLSLSVADSQFEKSQVLISEIGVISEISFTEVKINDTNYYIGKNVDVSKLHVGQTIKFEKTQRLIFTGKIENIEVGIDVE